jgi:hypothetical protein
MTILLQDLLRDRRRVCVVFHGGVLLCACGFVADDVGAVETHIVTEHEKGKGNDGGEGDDIVRAHLSSLYMELSKSMEIPCKTLEIPPKTHYVALDEDEIGGGRASDLACPECPSRLEDYLAFKSHFDASHGGSQMAAEGVIATRKELDERKRKEKGKRNKKNVPDP